MIELDVRLRVSVDTFSLNHPPRYADNCGVGRNRTHHHRTRADLAVATDGHRAKNRRASADDHAVFDRRMPFLFFQTRPSQRNALIDRHIVGDLSGLPDHHSHAVIDKETLADLSAGMDLDSSEETTDVADKAA